MKRFSLTLCFCVIVIGLLNCNGGEEIFSNGILTFAQLGSPETETITQIAEEFAKFKGVETPRIIAYSGSVDEFIKNALIPTLEKYGHIDGMFIHSDSLDQLIQTDWIKPYPSIVKEEEFLSEAIEVMKRNNSLYCIPIYIKGDDYGFQTVKGIGTCTKVEDKLLRTATEFMEYITNVENSQRIAEAAGGITARNL